MYKCIKEDAIHINISILEAMCIVSNENAYKYHIHNNFEEERIN